MIYKVKDQKGRLRMSTSDRWEAFRKFETIKCTCGYALLEFYDNLWEKPFATYGG